MGRTSGLKALPWVSRWSVVLSWDQALQSLAGVFVTVLFLTTATVIWCDSVR